MDDFDGDGGDPQDYRFQDIVYKACKFCGSLDYDLANGDVDEKNVYQPNGCDQCGFCMTGPHKLIIH